MQPGSAEFPKPGCRKFLARAGRCIYAYTMEPQTLLRDARATAGLSMRALAERAGTSTSTITRIEAGTMDPTVGMLRRLLLAAGHELEVSLQPRAAHPQLADLHDAWRSSSSGDRPDWTRLRAFVDHLTLHPDAVGDAIRCPPAPSGSALMDALLAAMADKLADDHHRARPRWTGARYRRLPHVWESPGTPSMRERAQRSTPTQFREHGVFLSADTLWRETEAASA